MWQFWNGSDRLEENKGAIYIKKKTARPAQSQNNVCKMAKSYDMYKLPHAEKEFEVRKICFEIN